MSGRSATWLWMALGLGLAVWPLRAHDGPPYPIVVDHPCGPGLLSVWSDPDTGTGTFFVFLDGLDPAPHAAARVVIHVQPVTGRLPEVGHAAGFVEGRRAHHFGLVPFDAEERWRVRIVVELAGATYQVQTEVEVTPPGLGALNVALYLFPFALLALLWTYGVARHGLRRRRRTSPAGPPG